MNKPPPNLKTSRAPRSTLVPKRYLLVLGTFLLSVLLYIDRVAISAAEADIRADLGLSPTQMGWILSIFALGYALFQTPAGILSDRFGPRRILAAVVTFWSIFTALTGAAFNFISMLVYRFLFGVGEAGAFPGMARAIFSWIPMKERGLIHGINFSGSRLGAAFALPAVAWLISTVGWRMTFIMLGLVGIGWAAFWFFWFRDDPTHHPTISPEERNHILTTRQQMDPSDTVGVSVGALLASKNMWLAMGQYFCSNFTFFFALTWLFPHVRSTYGLEDVEAAFYASAPLLAGAAGNWFSGWLVDRIYAGGHWRRSRRIPAAVGFSLAAAGLVASVYMDSVGPAVFFLSIAIFGADMTLSPSWSFCVDIGRKNSGAVSGTMNMAGNLGSFLTALAFPYLLTWTDSTTPFFFIGAGLNVVAIGLWMWMRPEKRLEDW